MDPEAVVERFNDPETCRAERVELAMALEQWLRGGGFVPETELDWDKIAALARHNEHTGFRAAAKSQIRILGEWISNREIRDLRDEALENGCLSARLEVAEVIVSMRLP